jgi:hypothetical protein
MKILISSALEPSAFYLIFRLEMTSLKYKLDTYLIRTIGAFNRVAVISDLGIATIQKKYREF